MHKLCFKTFELSVIISTFTTSNLYYKQRYKILCTVAIQQIISKTSNRQFRKILTINPRRNFCSAVMSSINIIHCSVVRAGILSTGTGAKCEISIIGKDHFVSILCLWSLPAAMMQSENINIWQHFWIVVKNLVLFLSVVIFNGRFGKTSSRCSCSIA